MLRIKKFEFHEKLLYFLLGMTVHLFVDINVVGGGSRRAGDGVKVASGPLVCSSFRYCFGPDQEWIATSA